MTPACVGVWIDHSTARVVELRGPRSPRFSTLVAGPEIESFYDRVVESIQGADGILVIGPDEAKRGLVGRMERKGGLQARILQTETTSKLTDAQILTRLQRFAATYSSVQGGKS